MAKQQRPPLPNAFEQARETGKIGGTGKKKEYPPIKTETQETVNPQIQEDVKTETQETVNPQIQEDVKTETQEDVNPGIQEDVNPGIQEDVKTETQEPINTGGNELLHQLQGTQVQQSSTLPQQIQEPINTGSQKLVNTGTNEKIKKQTIDLPMSLAKRVKNHATNREENIKDVVIRALEKLLAEEENQ